MVKLRNMFLIGGTVAGALLVWYLVTAKPPVPEVKGELRERLAKLE